MGTCTFCGKSAGILRNKHKECSLKHGDGLTKINHLTQQAILSKSKQSDYKMQLTKIAKSHYITANQTKKAIIKNWEQAVDHFLEDGNLDLDEESQLTSFMTLLSLSKEDLDQQGAFTKVVKGAVLRDIMNGKIPQRFSIEGNSPFNLQKSEKLIWLFNDVSYLEDKTRKKYVGAYRGGRIKVAKGVYFRVSGFRGHPVEETERLHVDTGLLAITTKHIYFAGSTKSFRVRFDKIVSFTPYNNGIGIQRDAATAKPQMFVTGDGWFIYNILANIGSV